MIDKEESRLLRKLRKQFGSRPVEIDDGSEPFAFIGLQRVAPKPCLDVLRLEILDQFLVRKPGDVLRVEPHQLVTIEYRVRFRNTLKGEGADQFIIVEELLIGARSPS